MSSFVIDANQNTYMLGNYGNDSSVATDTYSLIIDGETISTDTVGAFIVKFDALGDMQWIKTMSSLAQQIDVFEDDLYVSGTNEAAKDIFFEDVVSIVPTLYKQAVFLAKYNTDGDFIWAKHAGSLATDTQLSLNTLEIICCKKKRLYIVQPLFFIMLFPKKR